VLKDCNHKPIEGTAICATCEKPPDWQNHARCLDHDPEMFFPELDDYHTINQAIRICVSCPVRGFCLEEGWKQTRWGIWGSFTVQERERLRRAFPLPEKKEDRRRIIRIIAHRL
jgi:WhiB family redox-sensing transcriptional regulator